MSARHVMALAHKEALHLVRDPQAIALAIGLPVSFVLLFGLAVSFDADRIAIAVVDRDRSASSRAFVATLEGGGTFHVAVRARSPAELTDALEQNQVKLGILIERGFARQELRSEPRPVQVLVDGADTTTAQAAIGALASTAQHLARAGVPSPLTAEPRMMFNPEMRSSWFVVPGVVAVVLAIMAVLLSALTVAREWERGSMEQLFATPVGRSAVILGKLLPYVVLGQIQLLVVLTAGRLVFDVPIRGSLLQLLLASTLFLACALGQGLLISAVTKSQQLATQIGAVSSLLPSVLLSGFVFPIQNMPPPLQLISNVVPARWFIPILRGVMLEGQGLEVLWPSYLGLAILAVALITLATRRFDRSLE